MSTDRGLLLVAMEPPASLEEEFNDWYDTEHVPQRLSLPGFLGGRRFVCIEGWPRYLATYDLTTPAAVETPEYMAVSGSRSTPWSRRILPRTTGRHRIVARRIGAGSETLTSRPISRLLLARYPAVTDSEPLVAAIAEVARTMPGDVQTRLFASTDGDVILVAAFDRPPMPGALTERFAMLAGAAADLFNIYVPYVRVADDRAPHDRG